MVQNMSCLMLSAGDLSSIAMIDRGGFDRCEFTERSLLDQTYRHMNFFEHECHLHVRVPRIKRDDGRVKMILSPFAGELIGFTLLFEAFIIKFCKHMPVHNVCQLMNVSDYKVWKLLDIYC